VSHEIIEETKVALRLTKILGLSEAQGLALAVWKGFSGEMGAEGERVAEVLVPRIVDAIQARIAQIRRGEP
jgi:hypothetical protein